MQMLRILQRKHFLSECPFFPFLMKLNFRLFLSFTQPQLGTSVDAIHYN